MRVYINALVNVPAMYLPFIEKVVFADGFAWEFCDVDKMEFNDYSKALEIYFSVNGRSEEIHLYGVSMSDVFAVYSK